MNLTLIIRTWRNRYQGSDMHSVEIVRDGHSIAKLRPLMTEPVDLAVTWLEVSGYVPKRARQEMPAIQALADSGAQYHIARCNVANKSDL